MKICFIILTIAPLTFSQWETGASYMIKNEIPKKGVGINLSRRLPLQFATFGFKVRAEVNLFRQGEDEIVNGINKKRNYTSEDYHTEIICSFFFRNFTPYIGFGIGYGNLNVRDGSFLFNLITGLSFPISEFINPHLELQCFNYFSDLNSSTSSRDISSFQLRWGLGIVFSL